MDSGEAKESRFEERPDGEGRGGVEVAGNVPVAALEVADSAVTVPAFVGVLCPVHPRGVVGEVGVKVKGMEGEEERSEEEKECLDDLENTERDGVRLIHVYEWLNAVWPQEFRVLQKYDR
jgi:hypothetical protein